MNIFATEHPFDCRPEGEMRGLRSYFFGMLLVALILSPFFAGGIWFLDVTDNGDTTPGAYPPLTFWQDILAATFFSLIVAFAITALVALTARLASRLGKRGRWAQGEKT
jgi:hypothetical protein